VAGANYSQNLTVVLPREKIEQAGVAELTNAELLAVVFSNGSRLESALDMAKRVIKDYGVGGLASIRDLRRLVAQLTLPRVKALQLLAVLELGRRLFQDSEQRRVLLNNPARVARQFAHLRAQGREQLWAVFLNSRQLLIAEELLAAGGSNILYCEPKDILTAALNHSASGLVLVHNHPSQSMRPSAADLEFTQRLRLAAELVGIKLLDHIILGSGYYSFLEQGLLG
jgi:DNA repair protein RadC